MGSRTRRRHRTPAPHDAHLARPWSERGARAHPCRFAQRARSRHRRVGRRTRRSRLRRRGRDRSDRTRCHALAHRRSRRGGVLSALDRWRADPRSHHRQPRRHGRWRARRSDRRARRRVVRDPRAPGFHRSRHAPLRRTHRVACAVRNDDAAPRRHGVAARHGWRLDVGPRARECSGPAHDRDHLRRRQARVRRARSPMRRSTTARIRTGRRKSCGSRTDAAPTSSSKSAANARSGNRSRRCARAARSRWSAA